MSKVLRLFIVCTCVIGFLVPAMAQNKFTISGKVHDALTGEPLIGSTIFVKELANTGSTSNGYGFYSLTLPGGKYIVSAQFIG